MLRQQVSSYHHQAVSQPALVQPPNGGTAKSTTSAQILLRTANARFRSLSRTVEVLQGATSPLVRLRVRAIVIVGC